MIILRVTNDKGEVYDLQPIEDIDLRLDISAIENTEIGVSFGISSQEFAIAGDNDSNQFFGNLYNLGATPAVALQNSVDCQVLSDGQEVFTGKLYIRNIIADQDGYAIYNVIVVNETIDFKYRIQNLSLNDPRFDWSAYDHTLTAANVTGSWTDNLFSGSIIYPNINYGQPENDTTVPNYAFAGLNTAAALENTIDNYDTPLRLQDFKPAIKVKDVLDIIFSGSYSSGSTGYQYTSSFFESDYFNSLYLLTTANDQLGPNTTSPVSQSTWVYLSGSTQTFSDGIEATINFNDKSYDNSGNFNLSTDRYTADTNGDYRFTGQIAYNISSFTPTQNMDVTIEVIKIVGITETSLETFTRFNPYANGNTFLFQGTYNLNAGDEVRVTALFRDPVGAGKTMIVQPGLLSTFLQVGGPTTIEGATVQMNQQFSSDFKALDFIQGLIEKFNLVVEPVPNRKNLLSIEPYDTWVDQGTVIDWTNKVDRDINFQISHPAIEQPRTILFSDLEDNDYLNEYTRQTFGRTYGQYVFTADSDLPEGERTIGKVFAPTPTTNIPNSTAFIIPHLCTKTIGSSDAYRPIAFKPRLLYGIGVQNVESSAAGYSGSGFQTASYWLKDELNNVTRQSTWYQISSLSETPISGAAFDLHFNNNNQGVGAIPPYWSNVVPAGANFISGSGDSFTTYWANYINGLYDVDARKLVCNVYLAPNEIPSIRLNQKVFIDGAYYRINKINGANLTRRDTVEVELIKTIARQLTFPRRRITATVGDIPRDVQFQGYNPNGTGKYIDFNTGDIVDDYNIVSQAGPLDGLRVYRSGSGGDTGSVVWDYEAPTVPALQQSIIGTNTVAVDSSKITVLGSKNNVGSIVSTAQIMGQYNTIESNVTNAFVLGQLNTVGQTSVNTQILGGVGNYTSGSNNNFTIVGSTGSYAENTDYSAIINSYNAGLRDSDVTTLISAHENEVVINGSGHVVMGLNLEGNGLDLLNTRNNSNWLGDTYLGEAIFRPSYQLECGVGNISLTGSLQGQGKHENLYILNWSGLSPATMSIELPSATNSDYKNIVYQFQTNGTFDGTTQVNFVGFSGQLINGTSSYQLTDAYEGVTFTTSGSGWLALAGGAGASTEASYLSAYNSSSITTVANVSASVQLPSIDLAQNISIVSGSRITFDKAGVYDIQFSAQVVKSSGTNAPVFLWIRKNGNDVSWTNTEYIVPGNANDEIVLAWNWYVEAQTGDYYEIVYVDQQGNVTFQAKTGTPGPDVPSFIVTVGSIGGGNTTISGSAGGTIDVQEDGTPIVTSATILNFTGSGVNVTSGGGSTADIEINNTGFPYTGSAIITGSLTITGSAYGNVSALSIASNTASMDLTRGNFFTLTLPTSSTTFINPSNIREGQTANLRITSTSGTSTVFFASSVKQVSGSSYVPTSGNSVDILTFISFDTGSLYMSNVKNLV